MKNFTLTIGLLLAVIACSAQTAEVKINPIGVLFGNIAVSGEYYVSENFGAELTVGIVTGRYGLADVGTFEAKKSGFGVMGMGRYYFSPNDICDKFYAGVYVRQRSFEISADEVDGEEFSAWKRSFVAAGIGLGYKLVGDSGVLLDVGFGVGRTLSESNEWTGDEEGLEFPSFGIDGYSRIAIGYQF